MKILKKLNDKRIIAILIFLVAISVYSIDLGTPHEIWDERARYVAGLNQWFNIINGRFDAESWALNFQHPPMGKYLYGLVNGAYIFSISPDIISLSYDEALQKVDEVKNFLPGRFLAIFLAAGSIILLYLIGEEFFGRRVGILAALFLMLMPAFISQVRIESLEAPLIFFFMLSMYTFLKALKRGGNNNYYLLAGVFAGFAIASKFNNFILYIIIPVIYFAFLFLTRQKFSLHKMFPSKFLIAAVIPFAILFAIWPWVWSSPVDNFKESLLFWTYPTQEYFLGYLVAPPASYYIVYLFATMPVLLILFFLISMKEMPSKNPYIKILFIWFFISLLVFSFTGFKQNGARYIIAVYPAFALFVAIGFIVATNYLKRINKILPTILLGVIFVYLGYVLTTIHPYYLDYYNELTGGPGNVYEMRLFNIGWQGEGIDKSVEYLNSFAIKGSTVEFHVVPSHTEHKLRPDLIEVNPIAEGKLLRLSEIKLDHQLHSADYVVVNTYFDWYINQSFRKIVEENSYELVEVIDVQGATLVWIYKKI